MNGAITRAGLRPWRIAVAAFLLTAGGLAGRAAAQESPGQWLARILDPATLGLAPFPGAVLNRKLSVDAIVLERGGNKRVAMYIIDNDKLQAAADHFGKQFGVPAQVSGADSPFVAYTFDFTDPGKTPAAAARFSGLRVQVSRSQFVDGKGQIAMEYSPPAAPASAS